ncbi:MAG: hypothetical protein WB930_14330 [Syntrophobacteraceae bacterium]
MDDLALLPWWVNVIFAVIVYLCLKYWIPTIKFQNSFDAGTANAARALAPFLSAVILATAAVSAFNSRSKRRFPEKQKGAGSRIAPRPECAGDPEVLDKGRPSSSHNESHPSHAQH